jgi:hypothetical protein
LDPKTGLMWQREVDATRRGWQEARQYCAQLTVHGCSGWRLPSKDELYGLVRFSTSAGAKIDPIAFPNSPADWFWSGSRASARDDQAWSVDFNAGNTYFGDVQDKVLTRCVRFDASAGRPRFVTDQARVVVDRASGLTWQQPISDVRRNWMAAGDYCAQLQIGGNRDWRLPTKDELYGLIDFSIKAGAKIDPQAFPGTPADWFWTATRVQDGDGQAWSEDFNLGNTYYGATATEIWVRCLR